MKMYIGASEWNFDEWRGVFYPNDLSKSEFLPFYSKSCNTVEMNETYFRLPFQNFIKAWSHITPDDFVFNIKMNWKITHKNKMVINERNRKDVTKFFDRISTIRKKTHFILVQVPPDLQFDALLLKEFFKDMPDDYRYAIEIKDKKWQCDEFLSFCEEQNVIPIGFDKPNFYFFPDSKSDTLYFRFYGKTKMNQYLYSEKELREFAEQVLKKDYQNIYIYFDNLFQGFALENANTLKNILDEMTK